MKNKFFNPPHKKAQTTIFIIIGIVLITALALFLLVKTNKLPIIGGTKSEINANSYLHSCLEDRVKQGTNLLLSQGGSISNSLNKTFKFTDEDSFYDISFLCYTNKKYMSCINQEPMLIKHLEKELYNYIASDVQICFDSLASSLEGKGYSVDAYYNDFDIELEERKIIINIEAELKLTKSDETTHEKDFRAIYSSNIYDLAIVTQEIISQEAEYCNFDAIGFMLLYPKYKINRVQTSDLNTIYRIEYKKTKEKFRFAVRSCVVPPGF